MDDIQIISSRAPRAFMTATIIANILWINENNIETTEKLAFATKELKPTVSTKLRDYCEEFMQEWKKSWKQIDENRYWAWKALLEKVCGNKILVKDLVKPFFYVIQDYFEKMEELWTDLIIYSCRHGEKDRTVEVPHVILSPLTKKWEEQASILGKLLNEVIKKGQKQENKKTKIIILVWHEWIDEFLVTSIFGYKNIPEQRRIGRDFSKLIEYHFEKQWNESVLRVIREWEEMKITRRNFEKILSTL